MIDYIKGTLVKATPMYVIVDVNGMGYKVFIPANAMQGLPQIEHEVFLHTTFVVREISQTLYGFISAEQRDLFEELTNISGIGPKLALSLIGHLSIEHFYKAVTNGDVNAIHKVPGIGKKTAERLIIELKDKLGKSGSSKFPSAFAVNIESDPKAQMFADAIGALMNLGYNQKAAENAIQKSMKGLPDTVDLSLLITDALKNV